MALDDVMAKIQKAHQGDKAARDQLVMDNMGLVWSIVRRFKGRGYELEVSGVPPKSTFPAPCLY